MTCNTYDVVRVPFPFTDRVACKRRPALVISDNEAFNAAAGHSVMAMITSRGHAPWHLDCPIEDLKAAGLPAASVVRFKLFTVDHRLVLSTIGRLAPEDARRVAENLQRLLASIAEPCPTKVHGTQGREKRRTRKVPEA